MLYQKYLLFRFEGKLYKYLVMSNGLTSAPRIFTKLLKPVFSMLNKLGHNIMGYLDDSFIIGDTYLDCKAAVLCSVDIFSKLGFQVHPEKSQFIPKQEVEFLGFLINSKSMTVKITEKKQQKIISLAENLLKNPKQNTIREVSKFLGMCEAALPAVAHGRLRIFFIQKDRNNYLEKKQEEIMIKHVN